jgi:hypothetical protein
VSEALAKLLDIGTAWRRVKSDIKTRVFIRHPYSVSLIEFDLAQWLEICLDAIRNDRYSPSAMFVCDVPKGKGLVRPGSHLSYTDRLVYTACVGACFPAIHAKLIWSQGGIDFSYRLAINPQDVEWLRDRFSGWKDFQEKSLAGVDRGPSYVVIADISSFYENIDINLLISDLRDTGAPSAAIDQLSVCLNRWSQAPGRGIPQGQSSSDILAKLYLNNIDQVLRNMGYSHLRYVDDIRVFCSSEVEAKKGLIELSRLLRRRGLNLQSEKSGIYPAAAARGQIEEVTATVKEVRAAFITDVVNETGVGDPYMSIPQADAILDENPEDAPLEIIRHAYQTYIVERPYGFNATLFRFLINRLGKQRDSFASEHCVGLLEPHPEETDPILRYLGSVGPGEDVEAQIIELMRSGQMVYQYQLYQIIEWFYERPVRPAEALVDTARVIGFDQSVPRYLRLICRALLGKYGVSADLERMALLYDETTDPSERVEIICSIRRLERGRRNALLARFERDGEINRRAARWVRSES